MSYQERLSRMIYTAPSGARFNLRFETVTRELGKKAPVSEYPGQNQGGVQDLGQLTERYPVECFIDGQNYDLIADRFANALQEKGPGELDHPRWGIIPVLPVTVTQAESLVDGAGRATFSIDFIRAEERQFEYPRGVGFERQAAAAAAAASFEATLSTLEDVVVDDPGALATLKTTTLGAVNATAGAINRIAGIGDDVRASVNATVTEITNTIDALVQAPVNLANAFLQLYRLPADVVADTQAKIDGYKAIFETVVASFQATTARYGILLGIIGASQAQSIVAAAAEASLVGDSDTRANLTESVTDLAGLAADGAAAVEGFGVEDYDSQAASVRAATLAINALLLDSLNLPAEQVVITDQDITPLELVYQLYGADANPDMMLDRIIRYNRLQGSRIILIPQGTEVRWYV